MGPGRIDRGRYASFCDFYDGVFTRWMTAAMMSTPGTHAPRAISVGAVAEVSPTKAQHLELLVARIGDKIRAHATAESRSQHVSQMFLDFDDDRSVSSHVKLLCLSHPAEPSSHVHR